MNQPGEGAVPPRVRDAQGAGEAVLPLRGRQGLAHGGDRAVGVIITMSIVLGAELGPKADPTTTTYVPRPEWYFFFLFELLRVIKPSVLVAAGDDRHPDDLHDPAVPAAVRTTGAPSGAPSGGRSRPAAGIFTIAAMAYLTYMGASPAAERDRPADAAGGRSSRALQFDGAVQRRRARRRPVGLPGLPQDRRERQRRPRAAADGHRREPPKSQAIARTLDQPDRADAVLRRTCRRRSSTRSSTFLSHSEDAPMSSGTPARGPGPCDVRPHRGGLRPHELGHDRRPAPSLARARGGPGRVGPGARVLDVATGTGDLAIELAARPPGGEVVGCDFSEGMLERARAKAAAGVAVVRIRCEQGDALALPYGDDDFDAATVGFGARNFADLERASREMTRVVRPGGQVVVLEITTPQRPPLSTFFSLWFDRIVPLVGQASPRDPDAYAYLPNSVGASRVPEGLGAVAGAARGSSTSGGSSPPAASSPSTSAPYPRRDHQLRAVGRDRRGRRAARPELLARVEERLRGLARGHGEPLAAHAGATIAAGGKRLRPLLVLLAAAGPPGDGAGRLVRCAVAVELVHSATLVHDDVLDARRPAARAPDGLGHGRARHGDRRRATCCSRARSPSWRSTARSRRCGRCRARAPRWPRASCCQREDAWNAERPVERYLQRCELKTARAVRGGLRARRAARPGARRARRCGAFGRRHRPGLPVARRRPRRLRAAGAHRQAARDRPARRHRDPAAHPRARARPRRCARWTCARSTGRTRPRRSATASPRPARWRSRAARALERRGRREDDAAARPPGRRAACGAGAGRRLGASTATPRPRRGRA